MRAYTRDYLNIPDGYDDTLASDWSSDVGGCRFNVANIFYSEKDKKYLYAYFSHDWENKEDLDFFNKPKVSWLVKFREVSEVLKKEILKIYEIQNRRKRDSKWFDIEMKENQRYISEKIDNIWVIYDREEEEWFLNDIELKPE